MKESNGFLAGIAHSGRYMKKLKARAKKEPEQTVQVRAQDLERAGKLIIHTAQFKVFKDQLKEPAKGKEDSSMHVTTKLYNPVRKLDPYIDEDGVLRVAGQLRMQITLIRLNIP